MGSKYQCEDCGYEWVSRKSFGEPDKRLQESGQADEKGIAPIILLLEKAKRSLLNRAAQKLQIASEVYRTL